MQKLSAKLSKWGTMATLKKGDPRRPPRSPPLISTSACVFVAIATYSEVYYVACGSEDFIQYNTGPAVPPIFCGQKNLFLPYDRKIISCLRKNAF